MAPTLCIDATCNREAVWVAASNFGSVAWCRWHAPQKWLTLLVGETRPICGHPGCDRMARWRSGDPPEADHGCDAHLPPPF